MVSRSRHALTPERAANVHIHALAKKAAWVSPASDERNRMITDLQEAAARWPHLLAENAGLFLGEARHNKVEESIYLAAAQVLIDAGADLSEVERWTEIGYERTNPDRRPSY